MATFKAFPSLKEICVILSKLPEDCKSSFESYFMHHTNDLYDNRISEARAENGDIQLDFSALKSGVGRERRSRVGGR